MTAAGNGGRDNPVGNNGYGTITAPGNDPYVITVGAMKSMGTPQRSDDRIASYSSKGPTAVDHIVKPDLVAPGNLVVSADASRRNATEPVPGQCCSRRLLRADSTDWLLVIVFHLERNQHGCACSKRRGSTAATGPSRTDARSNQIKTDADG